MTRSSPSACSCRPRRSRGALDGEVEREAPLASGWRRAGRGLTLDVAVVWIRTVTCRAPLSKRSVTGSSATERTSRSFRFKMMSVTSSSSGQGRELVERVVEADLGHRSAGSRRAACGAGVPEGVAEAWVERPDGEALAVLALLVEGLDGVVDDEHRCWLSVCER